VVKTKDVMAGAILIVIGLIFLSGNLLDSPEWHLGRLWPVIMIVIGGGKILFPEGGSRVNGLPLVLVGSIFLAHNYRVISLRDSWPLFIVAAGISVLASAWAGRPSGQTGDRR
jgi:hypothetical protein